MRVFLILTSLFLSINLFSQECFVQKKKSNKLITRIYQNLSDYTFMEVSNICQEIENKEGASAQIFDMYSLIYWLVDDMIKAEEYAIKTIDLCPDHFSVSNYVLGNLHFKMKNYQKSVEYLEKSLEIGLIERFNLDAEQILERSSVLAQIMRDTVPYNPELVMGISTEDDEYLPLISPDQEIAFFTRRGSREDFGIINKKAEDFIKSAGGLQNFDEGEEMEFPFNQSYNEGGATISIDNNVMYLTICNKSPSSYHNCDIYYVERESGGGWSDIMPLSSVNNPKTWESQPSISSDGCSLVFSSDRPGGFGGIDLYIVHKDDSGNWGSPNNLGPIINSELDEKSPFLHVDGRTLYFASKQFPSLGGYDIFLSRLGDDNAWQRPQNVGFPINTKEDELGMFVTTDGSTAYFCSNKLDGIGGWDLYSFDLHKKARPKRVLFLKGRVTDSDGGIVDSVSLNLQNISTNEIVQVSVSGGVYVTSLTLEESDDVLITFDKEGYSFNSHYISSSDKDYISPSDMNVEMDRVETGETFEINNVYFETDSFNLNQVTRVILTSFAQYLHRNSTIELLIAGHTDNIGSNSDNLILSENRAKSVYSFLIDAGIKESRLTYKGYGEDFPTYDNSTEEGRSKNRRTECTIINK